MTIDLADVAKWFGVLATGIGGWLWREIASLRADNAALRTHIAEKYVTKDDNDKALDRVYASLERIEKKLDTQ